MAVLITEPVDNNPETIDWQRFLYRTTIQGGGFMILFLSNMENFDRPEVMAGSRLEVNASFYLVGEEGEEILDPPEALADNQAYFIYAIPQEQSLVFQFLPVQPNFDPMKGGWFSGSMRAVARMIHANGEFFNKVVLDTAESISLVNSIAPLPPIPSPLPAPIYEAYLAPYKKELPAGYYYLEMRGGGSNGIFPDPSEEIKTIFLLNSPTMVSGKLGLDGLAGTNGGDGLAAGNAGSGGKGGTSSGGGAGGTNTGNTSLSGNCGGGGAGGAAGGQDSLLQIGDRQIKAPGKHGKNGGGGGGGAYAANNGSAGSSNGAGGKPANGGTTECYAGTNIGGSGGRGGRGGAPNQEGENGESGTYPVSAIGGGARPGAGPGAGGIGGKIGTFSTGYIRIYKLT